MRKFSSPTFCFFSSPLTLTPTPPPLTRLRRVWNIQKQEQQASETSVPVQQQQQQSAAPMRRQQRRRGLLSPLGGGLLSPLGGGLLSPFGANLASPLSPLADIDYELNRALNGESTTPKIKSARKKKSRECVCFLGFFFFSFFWFFFFGIFWAGFHLHHLLRFGRGLLVCLPWKRLPIPPSPQ